MGVHTRKFQDEIRVATEANKEQAKAKTVEKTKDYQYYFEYSKLKSPKKKEKKKDNGKDKKAEKKVEALNQTRTKEEKFLVENNSLAQSTSSVVENIEKAFQYQELTSSRIHRELNNEKYNNLS